MMAMVFSSILIVCGNMGINGRTKAQGKDQGFSNLVLALLQNA